MVLFQFECIREFVEFWPEGFYVNKVLSKDYYHYESNLCGDCEKHLEYSIFVVTQQPNRKKKEIPNGRL